MKKLVAIGVLSLLVAVPGLVSAHQKEYVQTNPGVVISVATCPEVLDPSLTTGTGGVCYLGGHIAPVPYPAGTCGVSPCPVGTGTNQITLTDSISAQVAFSWCQSTDGNTICGEAGEPRVEACGVANIATGTSLPITGTNWRPDLQMWAFVRGVGNGNQVTGNPCGLVNAFGTTGIGNHL